MKKYVIFLAVTALILGISCTVQEFLNPFESETVAADENDEFVYLHQKADNENTDWNLILVNNWNSVPENYEISLQRTSDGEYIDERIYPFLEEMFKAARADGYSPEVTSGYRSEKEQKELFDERVKDYRNVGYSKKEATSLANEYAAKPGFSEHETGLAVDVNSEDGDSWALYNWLSNNCHKYGFIIRYPYGKEAITGIEYEPWHLRFTGTTAAEYIYENNITLEEYVLGK